MPYYKTGELKDLLRDAFMKGVIAGYDADHEVSLTAQEERAFQTYYEMQIEQTRQRRAAKETK